MLKMRAEIEGHKTKKSHISVTLEPPIGIEPMTY